MVLATVLVCKEEYFKSQYHLFLNSKLKPCIFFKYKTNKQRSFYSLNGFILFINTLFWLRCWETGNVFGNLKN